MFSLMVTNFKIEPALSITNAEGNLNKLYLLTNEYFYRILELVDNILEHSSTKKGVIISRVRKKEKAKSLHRDKRTYFDDNVFRDVKDFIEFSIMDIGIKGIISTSIERWQSSGEEMFKADASKLESLRPEKQLEVFFRPDEEYFQHQSIRTAACMGLLMFSSLIDTNKGFFEVEDRNLSNNSKATCYAQWFT